MRPLTSIFSTGQMPDGSGFYSRQMPHYVEPNRGQMPGGCPGGGGMIALGIDWYITLWDRAGYEVINNQRARSASWL